MKVYIDYSKMTLKDLICMKAEIEKHINFKLNENESKTPIRTSELSLRAFNILVKNNIEYLEDLTKISKKELFKFKNMGKRSYDEILNILNDQNINLAEDK
jgi:DNA-directed RNA polymerase alpha subunit